ncbi:hypothetical protein MTsPCn5_18220 [Croceitalea sp. MTPC5]|nr:hypothetical protein MTsPCn5_18220 [Croceitalea sp. MTPC5]
MGLYTVGRISIKWLYFLWIPKGFKKKGLEGLDILVGFPTTDFLFIRLILLSFKRPLNSPFIK